MGGQKINEDDLLNAGFITIVKQINKGISLITGSGITLTNNEIKGL